MRDQLRDLVEHTFDLGFIDTIKVVGTEDSTSISGVAGDRSVVLTGEFKQPIAEFEGTFGMPNMAKIKALLNIQAYRDGADITVSKQGDQPTMISFKNKAGDFKNDYRFMTAEIVAEQLKNVKFRGVDWTVECVPSLLAISKFKDQITVNTDETTFLVRVEDKNLMFYFGDHSTHAGNFVFQHNVKGTLNQTWMFPIKQIQAIFDCAGEKTISFADGPACQIVVETGVATYTYILPAMSK